MNNNFDILIGPNDKKCAYGRTFNNGSCIDVELLHLMAKGFNESIRRDNMSKNYIININNSRLHNDPINYKIYLLKEFSVKMKNLYKCTTQKCWIEQNFVNLILDFAENKVHNKTDNTKLEQLTKYTFAPDGPKCDEWLSTKNIEDYFDQIMKIDNNFKFLGAVPRDFDNLPILGLSDLNFDKYANRGIHKFGIVFNLDKHTESGSHWVMMYSDIKKGTVYFADSYGMKPNKEFIDLMNKFKKYIISKNITPDIKISNIKHQKSNSECGMYSMYFINFFRTGGLFENISNNKVPDSFVYNLREKYFYVDNKSCKIPKILRS